MNIINACSLILEPVFQSEMISWKILFLFLSVSALPIIYENKITPQNSTIESTEHLQENSGAKNEQKIGWRTRIEEDGWLKMLRNLSIVSVS